MSDAPDFEALLAGERCRDVHGDAYTAPWCHACRSWADSVASVLEAHTADLVRAAAEKALRDAANEMYRDGYFSPLARDVLIRRADTYRRADLLYRRTDDTGSVR